MNIKKNNLGVLGVVVFAISRKCVNSPNFLCVCGEFTLIVKKACELNFGCKVGGQNKSWAPHLCCTRGSRCLRCWLIGMHQSVPVAVPVVWWEQKDHLSDCYFCLTKIDGHNFKSKLTIVYPNIPSAPRRVEHDDSLPNPKPPQQWTVHEENQPAPLQKKNRDCQVPMWILISRNKPYILYRSLNSMI